MILFQAAGINGIFTERIAIILGLTTVALVLMTFTSCRTCVSILNRIGLHKLTANRIYQTFYRYHGYYWWLLGISLLSHLMMAVIHTGLPQANDSDAGLHWAILGIGLVNVGLAGALFSSCRISLKLLTITRTGLSLKNQNYRRFFQRHGLYWGILILVIAGHFTLGYLHAGLWPG